VPVDRAVTLARESVKMTFRSLEWATPVLFLASDETRVFAVPSRPEPLPEGGPQDWSTQVMGRLNRFFNRGSPDADLPPAPRPGPGEPRPAPPPLPPPPPRAGGGGAGPRAAPRPGPGAADRAATARAAAHRPGPAGAGVVTAPGLPRARSLPPPGDPAGRPGGAPLPRRRRQGALAGRRPAGGAVRPPRRPPPTPARLEPVEAPPGQPARRRRGGGVGSRDGGPGPRPAAPGVPARPDRVQRQRPLARHRRGRSPGACPGS